jgi:hypothetical protein
VTIMRRMLKVEMRISSWDKKEEWNKLPKLICDFSTGPCPSQGFWIDSPTSLRIFWQVFFFCSIGFWTLDLVLALQALFHLSHSTSPHH